MAKFLLVPIGAKTVKYTFVSPGEVGYDPATDLRPVPSHVQVRAEEAFGSVYCVDVEQLDGQLEIRRED